MKYQKEIYIFFHIPKCAGTTLRKNLEFNYRSNEVLNIYAAYNPVFKTAAGTENFIKKIPSKKKTKIKIIYGHNVHFDIYKLFPERKPVFITFFRNPFDRVVSLYNYQRTNLMNNNQVQTNQKRLFKDGRFLQFGEEWIALSPGQTKNSITLFLYNHFFSERISPKNISDEHIEKIKNVLDKFYFIGLTENEDDLFYIYNEMKISKFAGNINISHKFLTDEQIVAEKENILAKNQYDLELYAFAEKKNKEFKKEHSEFTQITEKIRQKQNAFLKSYRYLLINKIFGIKNRLRKYSDLMRGSSRK